jgi:hypothetical protein
VTGLRRTGFRGPEPAEGDKHAAETSARDFPDRRGVQSRVAEYLPIGDHASLEPAPQGGNRRPRSPWRVARPPARTRSPCNGQFVPCRPPTAPARTPSLRLTAPFVTPRGKRSWETPPYVRLPCSPHAGNGRRRSTPPEERPLAEAAAALAAGEPKRALRALDSGAVPATATSRTAVHDVTDALRVAALAQDLNRFPGGGGAVTSQEDIDRFRPDGLPEGSPRPGTFLAVVTDRPQDPSRLAQEGVRHTPEARDSSLQRLLGDPLNGVRDGHAPAWADGGNQVVRYRVERFEAYLHPERRADPRF